MDRCHARFLSARSLFACSLALLLVSGGCMQLAGLAYLIKGETVKAAYPGLEGKRVAVVCRPPATLKYRNATVARDLAKQVGILLKANLKKDIEVVDPREVAKWTDENDWNDYAEIGKALEVDMLVAIDLESFSLQEDPTLYQGKATVNISVLDMAEKGEAVFERTLPESRFPSSPTSSIDRPEAEFRRQFIEVLSGQVARHFYDHDAFLDFANDSKAL